MNTNIMNPVNYIEIQEIIEKLKQNGYDEIVECLLENEGDCYTKKGRLNKSATTRKMGWKTKQLEDALEGMKEILEPEYQMRVEDEEDESTK